MTTNRLVDEFGIANGTTADEMSLLDRRALNHMNEEERKKYLDKLERDQLDRLAKKEGIYSDADTTTVGQDIGNFFKVLFAFFSGMWKRDFYEFDLLSKVHFPDVLQTRVDSMIDMRKDPSTATVGKLRALTADLPSDGTLPAKLVERMKKDPVVAGYVNETFQAVRDYNRGVEKYNLDNPNKPPKKMLDETWMVRQFWQESGFNPKAKSSAGAMGIAQFMPGTGKQYGLSGNDFMDPHKSIKAGVQHMGDLTNKYDSQIFALFAYNGGEGSLQHAANTLTKRGIIKSPQEMTTLHLYGFYETERELLEKRRASGNISNADYQKSWAKQSLDYAKIIAGDPRKNFKDNLPDLTGQSDTKIAQKPIYPAGNLPSTPPLPAGGLPRV